jgi:hypothetical protein
VVEGLGSEASAFLRGDLNFTPLLCMLLTLMANEPSALKQSALALLGDVAKHCIEIVDEGHLAAVIGPVSEYISTGGFSVSNNATWALGEIAVKKRSPFIDDYVDSIATQLMAVLAHFGLHRPQSRPAGDRGRFRVLCRVSLRGTFRR